MRAVYALASVFAAQLAVAADDATASLAAGYG